MKNETMAATTPTMRLLQMGLSIAGGVGEGEGAVDNPAGDVTGGDESVVDQESQQQQGDQGQEGQGQQDGQGQDGQQGGEFGDDLDGQQQVGQGGGRAESRIRGLVDQVRQLEGIVQELRGAGRQSQGDQKPWLDQFTPDEKYAEFHQGAGGYMGSYFKHAAMPLARGITDALAQVSDLRDEMRFYGQNPTYSQGQRDMIERAREALSESTGKPWSRADVTAYLSGHPKYSKRFQTAGGQQQAIDNRLVAARRAAGRTGVASVGRVRPGAEPDLSTMSQEERVKFVESRHADSPI